MLVRTLCVVVVHAGAIGVPKEPVIAHTGEDGIVSGGLVQRQGLTKMFRLRHGRRGLHQHEASLGCRIGGMDVRYHHALGGGGVAGFLGSEAINLCLLV